MRTIRLLATSLLVALSMGASSCGDDEMEVNPPTTSGGETSLELICKEYGITDYKDIDLLNYFIHANNTIINKEQANFTGLKDNHLWVATYHNSTKEKLAEGTCSSEFQHSCKVFKEFEGYKDMNISKITPMWNYIINPSQFITIFAYNFKEDAAASLYSTLFYNNGKSKEIRGLGDDNVFNWYDNSVLIRDYCYTLDGDRICAFTIPTGDGVGMDAVEVYAPLSHSEIIYRWFDEDGAFIGRWNGTTKQQIWLTELKELSNLIDNDQYKVDFKLSDSSTNIWKFDATITSYDGDKNTLSYEIDIDNGTIKGEDNYASLIIGKWKMTSGNAIATHVTYKNDGTFEYTNTEDSSYKEVGKYKIDGNKLYEMYNDEEEWIINDILLLNSMTLSVQELEADGVTPTGQKYSYQRVE